MMLDTFVLNQFLSPKPTRLKSKLIKRITMDNERQWGQQWKQRRKSVKDQDGLPRPIPALPKGEESYPEDSASSTLM